MFSPQLFSHNFLTNRYSERQQTELPPFSRGRRVDRGGHIRLSLLHLLKKLPLKYMCGVQIYLQLNLWMKNKSTASFRPSDAQAAHPTHRSLGFGGEAVEGFPLRKPRSLSALRGRAPLLLSDMNMRSVASWLCNVLTHLVIRVLVPFRASKKKPLLLGIRG